MSLKERAGKVQELKRCKKVSKAFQIAKGLVKKLDSNSLGWVSACFSEISRGMLSVAE